MAAFSGFTHDDFKIFTIPDFHERMSAIRTRIRPKLAMLGEVVALGMPRYGDDAWHPHTASHARRRVNPPEDTWVAFSRSARGYKRYAHFEIGVWHPGVFVRFVVKPEGETDKPGLLRYLQTAGSEALALKSPDLPLYWYRDDHGQAPIPISELAIDQVIAHTALKTRGFTLGAEFERHSPEATGVGLIDTSLSVMHRLWPLYRGTLEATQSAHV